MTESGGSPVFRRVTSELPKIIVGAVSLFAFFLVHNAVVQILV